MPTASAWGGALLGARSEQQDTFLIKRLDQDGAVLAIVADGMGGQAAGALASQTAVAAFVEFFLSLPTTPSDLEAALFDAVDAANYAIDDAQAGHPDREGMGTTLLAVYLSKRGISWISVGDSPLLLCRRNAISRLNEDHSLRGLPEFRGGRHGNMLRSALTGQDIALVDCHPEPMALEAGDIVLLASDGLLTLSDDDVAARSLAPGAEQPDAFGQALLDAVTQKNEPKQDNCTVIVLAGPPLSSVPAAAAAAAAPKVKAPPAKSGFSLGHAALLALLGFTLIAAALLVLFW